jgi:hypothetical protein
LNETRAIQRHFLLLTNGGYPVTRISMTMMLTGTTLAMLAAAPALSVEAVNRIAINGLNSNRIAINGISLNLVTANGMSPSGLSRGGGAANSASEIGRVIAVELPHRSAAGISVWPALP